MYFDQIACISSYSLMYVHCEYNQYEGESMGIVSPSFRSYTGVSE